MAWDLIALGTDVEAASGNVTLNEPAGTAQGDLIVACIAFRSNAAFTLPTGGEWAFVATQQSSGDTDAIEGIASGLMAYCVRGANPPNYVFTRTAGDVAHGRTLAYRGVNTSSPYNTGGATTLGTIGEPALTGFTAAAGDLLVAMISHGDNSLTATMDAATDPGTASNGTDITTEPTVGTWIERHDLGDNSGADVGIFIADAVKTGAGATGDFSADAATTTRSVFIVGAFTAMAQTDYTQDTSDSLGLSDSVVRILSMIRQTADALGITDAVYRSQGHIRYIGGEGETTGNDYTRDISDALGITDAIVRAVGSGRRISDAVGLTDSAERVLGSNRRISDSVGLTDSAFRVHGSNRNVSDAVGLADALSKASGHARRLSDPIGVTDALSKASGHGRKISESVGITDAAVATRGMFRILSDTIGVTDALAFSMSIYINRYISDSVGITDSAVRYETFRREARDTLWVTDERVIQAAYKRFLSESLGRTDSVFRSKGIFRTASDSLGLSDFASRTLFVLIYRTVTESLGITDTPKRYQSAVRFLSENLGITDNISKASAISRTLSETMSIQDAADRAVTMIRNIVDSVGLSDSNLAQFVTEGIAYVRIISESLGITDARVQATMTIAWLMIALSLQRLIHIEVADPFCFVDVAMPFISLEAYKL